VARTGRQGNQSSLDTGAHLAVDLALGKVNCPLKPKDQKKA
jgi:hypothetical protein